MTYDLQRLTDLPYVQYCTHTGHICHRSYAIYQISQNSIIVAVMLIVYTTDLSVLQGILLTGNSYTLSHSPITTNDTNVPRDTVHECRVSKCSN